MAEQGSERSDVDAGLCCSRRPRVPQIVKPERFHLRILQCCTVSIVCLQHRLVLPLFVRKEVTSAKAPRGTHSGERVHYDQPASEFCIGKDLTLRCGC